MGDSIKSIADSQSNILKDSKDMQTLVVSAQNGSNQLNHSWSENLGATNLLKTDIAQTLSNTGEPGNRNQNVYHQLTEPVNVTGQENGNVNETSPNQKTTAGSAINTPEQPFLTLLALLIASILTGYFGYHYHRLSRTGNWLLSILLAVISSSVISYYGTCIINLKERIF
ncbi:hypothetical protein QS257_02620 [Terrilactibacillus sp. S3-3]|nr:hypothetical protein QS257_02620 [Terrilactibacillus sp. S3-3]